jgi:hypothetical protein
LTIQVETKETKIRKEVNQQGGFLLNLLEAINQQTMIYQVLRMVRLIGLLNRQSIMKQKSKTLSIRMQRLDIITWLMMETLKILEKRNINN